MNVYEIVNEKILKSMENNIIPWQKCWSNSSYGNPVSKTTYKGINVLLCWLHNMEYKLSSPFFVTRTQLNKLGYSLQKGAKMNIITFADKRPNKDDPEKFHWVFRYYPTFNIEHTTIPAGTFLQYSPIEVEDFDFLEGYNGGPPISFEPAECPYYIPLMDRIVMPPLDSFFSKGYAQGALFHEMIHSTLKPSRLDRKLSYAKEELVAEMGASYLMSIMGFEWEPDNSAAYIKNWAEKVKEDKTLFVVAAGKAQEAAEFILNAGPIKQKLAM